MNTLSENTFSENTLSENTLSENTLSENTLSEKSNSDTQTQNLTNNWGPLSSTFHADRMEIRNGKTYGQTDMGRC